MTRTGAYDGCLLIEKSKRNLCHYGTEVGNLLMGIYGREIEASLNENGGSFKFGYDIDVNGAVASKNTINMVFSKSHNQ